MVSRICQLVLSLFCLSATYMAASGMWIDASLDKNILDTYLAKYTVKQGLLLSKKEKKLETLFASCEVKLNKAMADCDSCVELLCNDPAPPSVNSKRRLLGLLKSPAKLLVKPIKALTKLARRLSKKAAKIIKSGLKKVTKTVSKGAKKVVEAVKKVGKVLKKTGRAIGRGFKHIARGTKKLAKSIGRGVKKVAHKVKHVVKKVGRKIGRFFKRIWGKRKRRSVVEIDPETKRCYAKCSACAMMTLSKDTDKIKHVCGSEIKTTNSTLYELSHVITSLEEAIRQGDLMKVQFNLKQIYNATVPYTRVTGSVDGTKFTYKSMRPYKISGMSNAEKERSIRALFNEFMPKWRAQFNKMYKY